MKTRVLLKFGEYEYLKSLLDGEFYFSNAKIFREIESIQKNKGQGDMLEGGSFLFALNGGMYSNDDNSLMCEFKDKNILIHYEPADNIPVYCMFSCDDTKVTFIDNNHISVHLSESEKIDIHEHFAKADSVAVFSQPLNLIEDFTTSLDTAIKADLVNYFNIYGYKGDNGIISMDINYMKYLAQDTPPKNVEGGLQYSFNADYVYRSLFCKDLFFKNQSEFRIVLSENVISKPKLFHIDLTIKPKIYDLSAVFNEDILVL